MVLPVSNSTSNGGVVLFLHILASMCCHLSFYLSHSDWRKVESQCCFDLYFLISKDFEHFFWSFSAFHSCSIVNSLFRYLPHYLIGLFGFLVVSSFSPLYILDISLVSSVGIEKNFFPICRLPLCPIYYVLCLTKFSSFLRSHLSIPDLRAWAIGVLFLGNFPLWQQLWGCFPLYLLFPGLCLVLCWGPWSTWTWALCKVTNMDLFSFFYMQTAS